MVAVSGRSTLRSKSQDDLGPLAADQRDDLADDGVGIRGGERTVGVSTVIDDSDAESCARLDQLSAADAPELLPRRHGDAGRTSGIPVSGRVQRAAYAFFDVLRQGSPGG